MACLRWGVCVAAILSVAMAASESVPNVEVMYDHPVNLTCTSDSFNPSIGLNFVEMMWLLPNGDLVKKTDQHKRVVVYEDGKHITIKKVDDVDFGVYNCLIYTVNSQNYHVVQKGINLNGPFWGDLMEKYRMNLIVGCITAAVVFLLMLGMCFCINQGGDLDRGEDARVKNLWIPSQGVDNPAMEMGDVEVQSKTAPPISGDHGSLPQQSSNLSTNL